MRAESVKKIPASWNRLQVPCAGFNPVGFPPVSPDFSQAERGLFAIGFRRKLCAGSFDSVLAHLAQG